MSQPTDEQRADARLHATVWEGVHRTATDRRIILDDDEQHRMVRTLGKFALIVAGEYRKIANGREIED